MSLARAVSAKKPKLLGLFELDANGKILYSSVEADDGTLTRDSSLDGTNFFTDLAQFTNTTDFQRRFDFFRLAEMRSLAFPFDCQYADGPFPVKVLMARLLAETEYSFLLHMQRAGSGERSDPAHQQEYQHNHQD
jgi:hypothetical protein